MTIAELEKQIAEETELNDAITSNLAKIKITQWASGTNII